MYYYKKTTNRLNKQALKESTLLAAETINKELSLHLGTVRGLASNFGHTIDLGWKTAQTVFNQSSEEIAQSNIDYYGVWHCWQYSKIKPHWGNHPGRLISAYTREKGKLGLVELERDVNGLSPSPYHDIIANKKK